MGDKAKKRNGPDPSHRFWSRARHARLCEGVNPEDDPRSYATGHSDIERGARYLRKLWYTPTGIPYYASHCEACAAELSGPPGDGEG